MSDEYETKVVNLTQYYIGGAPYPVPYNPSPKDSGWLLRADDSSTVVVFKRKKK